MTNERTTAKSIGRSRAAAIRRHKPYPDLLTPAASPREMFDFPIGPLSWMVRRPLMPPAPYMIDWLRKLVTIAAEEYLYAIRLSINPKYARKASEALSALCQEANWPGEGQLMQSAVWARSILELSEPSNSISAHEAACRKAGTESRFAAALAKLAEAPWPSGAAPKEPTKKSLINPLEESNDLAKRDRWLVLAGYAPPSKPSDGLHINANIRSRIAYASVEVERGLRTDCTILGRQLAACIDQGAPVAKEDFTAFSRALGWWWVAGNENSAHQNEGFRYGVARFTRGGATVMEPMSPKTWRQASDQMFEVLTNSAIIERIRFLRNRNCTNGRMGPISPALTPRTSGRDLLIASLFCRFMFDDLIVSPTVLPSGSASAKAGGWRGGKCIEQLDQLNEERERQQGELHELAERLRLPSPAVLDMALANAEFHWARDPGESYRYCWDIDDRRLYPMQDVSPRLPGYLLKNLLERVRANGSLSRDYPAANPIGSLLNRGALIVSSGEPSPGDLAWWVLESWTPKSKHSVEDLFGLERILEVAKTPTACLHVLKEWKSKPLNAVLEQGKKACEDAEDTLEFWKGIRLGRGFR